MSLMPIDIHLLFPTAIETQPGHWTMDESPGKWRLPNIALNVSHQGIIRTYYGVIDYTPFIQEAIPSGRLDFDWIGNQLWQRSNLSGDLIDGRFAGAVVMGTPPFYRVYDNLHLRPSKGDNSHITIFIEKSFGQEEAFSLYFDSGFYDQSGDLQGPFKGGLAGIHQNTRDIFDEYVMLAVKEYLLKEHGIAPGHRSITHIQFKY